MSETRPANRADKKACSELDFSQLCDRLSEKKPTAIIFHAHPDGDAIGSAFALSLLLFAAGSPAFCVCADEIPRRFIFAVGDLQKSVLPEALPAGYSRVISIDTPSIAQMGRLSGFFGNRVDIMIDHHRLGEIYADYYIDPGAAAVGEIIYDISREFLRRGLIRKIPERFDLLAYIAIASDTGCFRYSNTTPATHMRAADLMSAGSFDCADVNYRLFDSKTQEELKITRAALESIQYFNDGEISVTSLDYGQKTSLGVSDEHLDILIDVARSVEGVKVAVSVKQPGPDNIYRASLRSNCEVDVSAICARFGGGGHNKAAGCTFGAKDMTEAISLLVDEIRRDL
ncbi:MAG: DHH family phosphoesterase [Eubacteriales bacterium]|jgi:phosphoesterase RecJ-like protein